MKGSEHSTAEHRRGTAQRIDRHSRRARRGVCGDLREYENTYLILCDVHHKLNRRQIVGEWETVLDEFK